MTLDELIVRIQIDDTAFERGLSNASRKVKGFDRTVASSARSLAAWGAAAVGATVALQKFTERGGDVIQVQRAFAARVGDGAAALANLERRTRGVISRYELLRQANTALALGSASTAEEFGDLADISLKLARAQGIDATHALNSLNTGIARQSRQFLDNLGIIISVEEANKAYAQTLDVAASELSDIQKREAFRNAALAKANELVASFGDQSETAADSALRFGAQIKNITDRLSVMLAQSPHVKSFFDGLNEGLDQLSSGQLRVVPGPAGPIFLSLPSQTQRPSVPPTLSRARNQPFDPTGATSGFARFTSGLLGTNLFAGAGGSDEEVARRFGFGGIDRLPNILATAISEAEAELQALTLERALAADSEEAEKLSAQIENVRRELALLRAEAERFGGAGSLGIFSEQLGALSPGLQRRLERATAATGIPQARVTGRVRASSGRGFTNVFSGGLLAGGIPETLRPSLATAEDAGRSLERLLERGGQSFVKDVEDAGETFGSGIGAVLDATFDPANLGAGLATSLVAPLIGQGLGLVGGLFGGLFGGGDSRNAQIFAENNRILEANNRHLSDVADGFRRFNAEVFQTPGEDFEAVLQGISAFLDPQGFDRARQIADPLGFLDDTLRQFGITLDQARELAARFGIELPTEVTGKGLNQLNEALGQLVDAINSDFIRQLSDTFQGAFDLLQREFALLDVDDPMERFGRTIDLLTELVGDDLAATLRGLTPDNIDDFIAGFLGELRSGDFDLSALGGLTVFEFLDALGFAEGALDGFGDTLGRVTGSLLNVPQGFKVAFRTFQVSDPFSPQNPLGGAGFSPLGGPPPGGLPDTRGGTPDITGTTRITNTFHVQIRADASTTGEEILRKIEGAAAKRAARGGVGEFDVLFGGGNR